MMFELINWLLKFVVTVFFNLPFIEDHSKTNKEIRELVGLYQNGSFGGVSIKIRFWDSPLEELEKMVPKEGKILDLGCGEGILTNYMALSEPKRSMIGIELNKERTKYSNRGLKNVKFIQGNVLKTPLPISDAIVMSHMMHHLPSKNDQLKLIKQCHKSLNKNGKLIIGESNKGFTFRYFCGWITDIIIVPILFEGSLFNPNIFHRSKDEWHRVLEELNFKVDKIMVMKKGPFADMIILAHKG